MFWIHSVSWFLILLFWDHDFQCTFQQNIAMMVSMSFECNIKKFSPGKKCYKYFLLKTWDIAIA